MSIKFNRSQTFATNGTVTAAGLHNLVDGLDIYQALITDQTSLSAVAPEDSILIADASLTAGDAPRQTTVQNLFEDALSSGTYVSLNLSGALTYGTATGNRTVSTSATITTGTIPNLTAGTTTGTLATLTNANITNGTIQTLTSSTATITGGTFSGSVNSTAGTIATLNSTTGTIGNLSTTLAGDLTISQGTATLGTSGVTASSYGTTSDIPRITVDAKGRITSASTVTAPVGFRNRIINGDMRIDQRNAGASVTYNGAEAIYNVDRWQAGAIGGGAFTVQQSSVAPSGFTNSQKYTVTTTDTSLSASDRYSLYQYIEGYNVSDLAFGTSAAIAVTVSFWVRSSVTGTYGIYLSNGAFTQSISSVFSISSANTWERKSITFAGSTTGSWETGNLTGLVVGVSFAMGSNYQGTANTWASAAYFTTSGQTNFMATNGATFYITGVQLEAGSTATDFERRPYGVELALCQRYFQKSYPIGTAVGTATSDGRTYFVFGAGTNTANKGSAIQLKTTMRSAPTITIYNESGATGSFSSPAVSANLINVHDSHFHAYAISISSTELWGTWIASAEL